MSLQSTPGLSFLHSSLEPSSPGLQQTPSDGPAMTSAPRRHSLARAARLLMGIGTRLCSSVGLLDSRNDGSALPGEGVPFKTQSSKPQAPRAAGLAGARPAEHGRSQPLLSNARPVI